MLQVRYLELYNFLCSLSVVSVLDKTLDTSFTKIDGDFIIKFFLYVLFIFCLDILACKIFLAIWIF